MEPISNVQGTLVLRTDFSDDAVWDQICRILDQPTMEGHNEPMNYVNDPQYEGVSIAQLFSIIPDPERSYVFVVDATTISDPTHPLLIVDIVGEPGYTKPGRYARITAEWTRDAVLQFEIGNLDIYDYLPADFDHEAYDDFDHEAYDEE